ncbi:MAG: hypothetical protein PUJ51_02350 [Clostridiales bacterium]|uniref:hypothetical protein n=1 Tax=Terrisporobacter sp. TaxID=1965305 RepID=UPI002A575038|nr:hypothetical protein [Terrisporobacter sp.]MDD7753335.1 hypothetical protein [Clostridiales bacterium]MDY4134596.1 hypothetical protein [Terrisporobacter sp.]
MILKNTTVLKELSDIIIKDDFSLDTNKKYVAGIACRTQEISITYLTKENDAYKALIETTIAPGKVIDSSIIERRLNHDNVIAVGYDLFNMQWLKERVNKECIPVIQNFNRLTEPTNELIKLIEEYRIVFKGHIRKSLKNATLLINGEFKEKGMIDPKCDTVLKSLINALAIKEKIDDSKEIPKFNSTNIKSIVDSISKAPITITEETIKEEILNTKILTSEEVENKLVEIIISYAKENELTINQLSDIQCKVEEYLMYNAVIK